MTSLRRDYANEKMVHRNRLPPRAYYLPKRCFNLGGLWDFSYSLDAERPLPDVNDSSKWQTIQVPGHWQLQGYGRPHYTNVQFPFPVDPPYVPSENPTGIYHRSFAIPVSWGDPEGLTYRLRFEGVDSAFHLFVNGEKIGYSQGSRNAAEFDVSNVVTYGEARPNEICVKVYQWSDGSYIEDQDQWWLSGIYRNVYLLAFSGTGYVEDFHAITHLDDDHRSARFELNVGLRSCSNLDIEIQLVDCLGSQVLELNKHINDCDETVYKISEEILNPLLWTAETPNLYTLRIILSSGQDQEIIEQSIGVRNVEIKNGKLMVNGKSVLLKGVNRHDHHPRFGRSVPYDFMRQDLLTMKRHNINALRCSHYPNAPELYQIANEIGLYVMNEADLECHGFYDAVARPLDMPENLDHNKRERILFDRAAQFTSNNPAWKEAYVERMRQLVHRDKNHPCIIMWSLGNEAFYGENHQAMYDWAKKVDPTRPIHYEGDKEAKSADVFSFMYPSVQDLIEHAKTKDKPVVLCEYGHAMGAGPGALKEYQEAFYKYPTLCGGFVWEWANHGLLRTAAHGQSFYGYGGDFGDCPNDGNFVMDGLLDSEHRPGPGLIDFKSVIQPVVVRREGAELKVLNLYDFLTLDHLVAFWEVVEFSGVNARQLSSGILDLPQIAAGNSALVSMPRIPLRESYGETWLNISFKSIYSKPWDDAGVEIAWSQIAFGFNTEEDAIASSVPIKSIATIDTDNLLRIGNQTTKLVFDKSQGLISNWSLRGYEMFYEHGGPRLTFWRAITDNDRPQDALKWQRFGLDNMTAQIRQVECSKNDSSVNITVQSYLAPPVLAWGYDVQYIYSVDGLGVSIEVNMAPRGHKPPTLPRVGFEMKIPKTRVSKVKWYGLGPYQSYSDMDNSVRYGLWTKDLEEMNIQYEKPQEHGNRSGVRWARLLDELGNGIQIRLRRPKITDESGSSRGADCFDFAVHKHTVQQLDAARHPCDLIDNDFVVLRVDAVHRGLGTGSCGPGVLEKYDLKCEAISFTIEMKPVHL